MNNFHHHNFHFLTNPPNAKMFNKHKKFRKKKMKMKNDDEVSSWNSLKINEKNFLFPHDL
jgi:hypothetical protein